MNRPRNKGLLIGILTILLLSITVNSSAHPVHIMQYSIIVVNNKYKGRFRFVWINPRLEEAFDCIRRLPPPGNTRQTTITSFFGSQASRSKTLSQRLNIGRRTNSFISILQWNSQSLTEAKAQEIAALASEIQLDVICVSELGHRRTIPGFKVLAASSTDTQSGVFCRSKLPALEIEMPALSKWENESILTQVALIDNAFILIHVYIAPRVSIQIRKQYWSALAETVRQYPDHPITITGDLNTKSPEISDNHTSETHTYFSTFIENAEMQILNDSTPTRGLNTLDVTMANDRFHRKVTNWQVLNDLGSDHLPTLTETSFQATVAHKKGYISEYRYLNVKATIRNLKRELYDKKSDLNNLTLGSFHTLLTKSLKFNVSNKAGSPIWTTELTHIKRARNRVRKRMKNASPDQLEMLKLERDRLQKSFQSSFNKAKRQFQQQQAESIAGERNSTKAWKLTNSFIPATRKKSKRWHRHTESAITEANKIAKKFAEISADPAIQVSQEIQGELDSQMNLLRLKSSPFKPITMRELKSSIKVANSNSASGADGISVKLLQAIINDHELGSTLRGLFSEVLVTGEFPDELKIAKIKALPKQNVNQHRPISLLPTMGKLLERIITTRIREQMSSKFHKSQHGCRAAHGTSTAIARLLHHSGIAAAKNEHFGFITFDFSKAYDRVNRSILLSKMIELGIDPYLILVVENWLQNRKFFVSHRGVNSDEHNLPNGIPQGSALSVLLWLIYVNDIDVEESSSNIYVDDVIIWASGSTRKSVLRQLQSMASRVVNWSEDNRVKINFDKTHLLINGHDRRCSIAVSDHVLKNQKKVKYLGVDFVAGPAESNSSLGYDLHAAAGNIRRRCAIIKPMRRLGFSQHHIAMVVNGYIGGKLRYYTPWLGTDIHDVNRIVLDPLIKAYNQMMRIVCQAVCTTPIALLHAGSRMPLLSSIIRRDSTRLVLSSIAANNILGQEYTSWDGVGDGWSPLGCAWNTLAKYVPSTYESIQEKIKPTLSTLDMVAKCSFKIAEDREHALSMISSNNLLRNSPDIEVWTDGSFSDSRSQGGTGVVIFDKSQKCYATPSNGVVVTDEETELGVESPDWPQTITFRHNEGANMSLSNITQHTIDSGSSDVGANCHSEQTFLSASPTVGDNHTQFIQNNKPIETNVPTEFGSDSPRRLDTSSSDAKITTNISSSFRSNNSKHPQPRQIQEHIRMSNLREIGSNSDPGFDEIRLDRQNQISFSSISPLNNARDTRFHEQLEHGVNPVLAKFQGSSSNRTGVSVSQSPNFEPNSEILQTSRSNGMETSEYSQNNHTWVLDGSETDCVRFRDPLEDDECQTEFGSKIDFVTSSYDVEVEALLEALNYLTDQGYCRSEVAIYSDSRSLMSQLEAITLRPKLVDGSIHAILSQLTELVSKENHIHLTWVPGHAGIEGNERADHVAKQNLTNATSGTSNEARAPRLANLDYFLKKYVQESLDEYLNNSVKPSSQESYPERDWFRGKQITVGKTTRVVYPYKLEEFDAPLFRVRTGHTYTRDHLFRFGIVKDRSCRYCGYREETAHHLSLECRYFDRFMNIVDARSSYIREVGVDCRLEQAVWSNPAVAKSVLHAVRRHASCI